MGRTVTYCDYNAGAPVRAEAAVAMARALALGGNASSIHSVGRAARGLIEQAREKLGLLLEARPENLVFTSGATEALHLALAGAGAQSLLISAVEHDAVYEHARQMKGDAQVIPVDANGVIDLEALSSLLGASPRPALVALQLANNETGIIQPVKLAAALCRQYGAMLLVDAAQAFTRLPVSAADLDATYLVASSHKIGGPPGAGLLALAPGAPFLSHHFGGMQERGRRPGTENMPAIIGFAVAAEWGCQDILAEHQRLTALRDKLEALLPSDARVFGSGAARLPNTTNFAVRGITAETAIIALDLAGVAVSSGAACSSGKVRASRVLSAMGVEPALSKSAIRVSFGHASTTQDVDVVAREIAVLAKRRRVFEGAA